MLYSVVGFLISKYSADTNHYWKHAISRNDLLFDIILIMKNLLSGSIHLQWMPQEV